MLSTRGISIFRCIVVMNVLVPSLTSGTKKLESNCETLPSEIHITKEEFDDNQVLKRTCQGDIAVNKCEGACTSGITPSALSAHGYQKECSCCRESGYRERQMILTDCFDPDGRRLSGDAGEMKVNVNEPVKCQCHACGKKL